MPANIQNPRNLPANTQAQQPANVRFRRSPEYKETYLAKVNPYESVRNKFREFMELKRNDPNQAFGKSDKHFLGDGFFTQQVPGLKHAHITQDLSIVYKISGKNPTEIYLYGFYTHDELGTGQPPNIRRQSSIAKSFRSYTFTEE